MKWYWVKANAGTVGNETADQLAIKGAGQEAVDVQVKMSAQSIKTRISHKIRSMWQKRWDETNTGRYVYWHLPKVKKKGLGQTDYRIRKLRNMDY